MQGITEIARKFVLNSIEFSEQEVADIKALFPKMDMAVMKKKEITRSKCLQKALKAGAVLTMSIQPGDNVTLSLSQQGRFLLERI